MPIRVMLCCNDDNGAFTGRAHRIDFEPLDLTIEETLWTPRGVVIDFQYKGKVRIGRCAYPILYHQSCVGNIYWDAVGLRGVHCFQLMNYMMRLKRWDVTSGETFLFDKFKKRERIDPHEYFKWQREQQESRRAEDNECPGTASADAVSS